MVLNTRIWIIICILLVYAATPFFYTTAATAAEAPEPNTAPTEWILPPIVTQVSPAEVLQQDAVVPTDQGPLDPTSSTGSTGHALHTQVALPVLERGRPGTQASFLGLGAASEETQVQAFGVPLNPPQGGGFDLSVFPQYLFSGYRFQAGPSLSSFEPRTLAGTLTFMPWTEEALNSPDRYFRLFQIYSDAKLTQVAMGYDAGERAAILLGLSDGDAKGPSGSFSARIGGGEKVSSRIHLLGSSIDAKSPGSKTMPTPDARQKTTRILPVFQTNVLLSPDMLFKGSLHFDSLRLRYENENPATGLMTRDTTEQAAANGVLLWREWKLGLGVNRVGFERTGFKAPTETQGFVHASKAIERGNTVWVPTLQGQGVSRMGIRPAASLGVRHRLNPESDSETEMGHSRACFARLSYSRRFASLLDRYYEIPGFFNGNPGLRPEKDYTLLAGLERKYPRFEWVLQGYGQLREDAQILLGVPSPYNAGRATLLSLMASFKQTLSPWVDLSNHLTLNRSKIQETGKSFPYQPGLADAITLHLNPDFRTHTLPLSAEANLRFATSAATGAASGDRVPGYGFIDIGIRYRLYGIPRQGGETYRPLLDLTGKVENALDRPIEFVKDYPSVGRIISVALVGEF